MLDSLPDVPLICILDHLDLLSIASLSASSQRIMKRIPKKYITMYFSISKKPYIEFPFPLHEEDHGNIYTIESNGILNKLKPRGKYKSISFAGDDWIYVIRGKYYKCIGKEICIFDDLKSGKFIRTGIIVQKSEYVYIKKEYIFLQKNTRLSYYDCDGEYKGTITFSGVKYGAFDICTRFNHVYYITCEEKLYKYSKGVFIDYHTNIEYSGEAETLRVYDDKLYLGLKSGVLNIYDIVDGYTIFSKHLKIFDTPIQGIGVMNNIILAGSFDVIKHFRKEIDGTYTSYGRNNINNANIEYISNINFFKNGTPYADVYMKKDTYQGISTLQ